MARKAQAALEYLFTYGWAFLAILLTIGTLAYFGIFDVDNLRSNSCSFPPGANCEDWTFNDDLNPDNLVIILLNSFGVDLNVTDFNATADEFGATIDCDTNETTLNPGEWVLWQNEEEIRFECEVPSAVYFAGETYEVVIGLEFSQPAHSYVHRTTGELVITAQ